MTRQEQEIYALVVGRAISLLREHRRLTQTELAESVGITQSMLSRIERGQAQPEAFALEKLARSFGMASSADLMTFIQHVHQVAEQSTYSTLGRREPGPWYESAVQALGQVGIAALVTFAVCVTLANLEGNRTSLESPSTQSPANRGRALDAVA